MRILNIIAQKPMSTGSGIYLTELVRVMAEQGHTQGVVAGVYKRMLSVFLMLQSFILYITIRLSCPLIYLECRMKCRTRVAVIVT